MKSRSNLVAMVCAFAFLVIAYLLDSATDSLNEYASTTFNFPPSLAAQFGIALLFALLIFVFVWITSSNQVPDRWVYAVFLVISMVSPFLFISTFLIPIDFVFYIPHNIRFALTFEPRSYAGIATLVLFWAGLRGLVYRKNNSNSLK